VRLTIALAITGGQSLPINKLMGQDLRLSSQRRSECITLAHGGGGKAMRDLIANRLLRHFNNAWLAPLEDQARLDLEALSGRGDRLAFTTDSFVVDPLIFPGGDIGMLAVNGTVNDLAMGGAQPLYLSCGVILEEGLPLDILETVIASMSRAAKTAGVAIVTGDTKVVPRGAVDKLFLNTAGLGVIPAGIQIAAGRAQPGDIILVNGFIGDHGAAIVDARGDLALENPVASDCQPLHGLVAAMLAVCPDIHCLRDATRGGIAAVLNEFAQAAQVGMLLKEAALPVREAVRGVCEILGFDPLYLANEGKLVAVVPPKAAGPVLSAIRAHPAGREAAIVGEVTAAPPGRVVLETAFGGERIVDMLVGEQLPRIC
jgi:hydrogenase expression/formation protein HypE